MDELEMRVAALEAAVTALCAWLPGEAVDDAVADLRDMPPVAGLDEVAVRKAAADILAEGRLRFNGLSNPVAS